MPLVGSQAVDVARWARTADSCRGATTGVAERITSGLSRIVPARGACVGLLCLALTACSLPGGISSTPVAVKTQNPGQVDCPDGRPARPGLKNFGAFIGTWQTNHQRDPKVSTAYAIGMIPGRVVVTCSNDDFVVMEEIYPRGQSPLGEALRVALTDLPQDSTKVYEHAHTGCYILQFQSKAMARQLGAKDADGRVTITMESQTTTFNPCSVYLILIDLHDLLGQDTHAC